MKTINITRIPLLTIGFLGALMILSATDTLAQRRTSRGTPLQRRIVKELPQGSRSIDFEGKELFNYNGVFYREARENFVVVRPPLGAVVTELPSDTRVVSTEDGPYYMDKRTFYKETNGGFEIVKAPFGKTVTELPGGYETLAMRGEAELYFLDGLIYKADSETDTYTIVGPPRRGGQGQGQARFSRAGHRANAGYSRTGRRGSTNYRNSGVRHSSGFRNQGFRGNASLQRHGLRNGSGFEGGSRSQGRQYRFDRRDIEPQGWRRDGRL